MPGLINRIAELERADRKKNLSRYRELLTGPNEPSEKEVRELSAAMKAIGKRSEEAALDADTLRVVPELRAILAKAKEEPCPVAPARQALREAAEQRTAEIDAARVKHDEAAAAANAKYKVAEDALQNAYAEKQAVQRARQQLDDLLKGNGELLDF